MEERIVPKPVEREMQEAYLDYAMSVIVSRALPDVRDGLKPVQRRILVAMHDLGLAPNRPYRKCAKICGDTSGNYHPHGEAVIYPTLVRMAQPWVMRHPLVDGQGNFGSVDDDPPAAMRYCVTGDTLVVTEAGLVRMDRLARQGEEDVRLRVLSVGGKVNTASKWFDCGPFPTWRVRTSRGYEVTGTANHPLLACVRGEDGRITFVWKTISEIRPGDWLVLDRSGLLWPEEEVDLRGYHPDPRSLPPGVREHALPSHLDEDLAFILGALVAQGTFRRQVVEFTNAPGEFADAFRSAWERAFPTCPLQTLLRNPTGYGRKPFWQMQVASGHVIAFVRNLGLLGRSGERLVPEAVLRSPRPVAAAFLRGLYEGDGSLERSGRSLLRVGLCGRNRAFLQQVQVLLLRFGIASTLSTDRTRGTYRLFVFGRDNLRRFQEHIGFVSAEKRDALAEALGAHSGKALSRTDQVPFLADFVQAHARRGHREWLTKHSFHRPEPLVATLPRLREALPVDGGRQVEELARLNYLFDRVTAVEDAGEQRVYSIRVDSPCHSFVANGFINHNTEARLTPVAMEMLADLDKDTVDFVPNFDQTRREPVVLPARFPNLLVNGASGIAVGMATNIPPHNLGEVTDALVALLDNPDLTTDDLLRIVKGPDFPTGGIILGREGIREAYTTGRGSILMRAKATVEELRGGRTAIVVTELPYMVNKAALIARIADLVREKRIQGISDLRDESDREGMRVVIELRREANPQVVLNQLYKHTQMQVSFGAILLALVGGVPRQLTLRDLLIHYLDHRREIVTRRTRFELARAEERAHVLEGLKVALDHLDAVIQLIRSSKDVAAAREGLVQRFGLSERQADAILEMRLARLTALERSKVEEEYRELLKAIAYYQDVLRDPRKVAGIVRQELLEVKAKYADPRRTRITSGQEAVLEEEDLVPDTEVVITLTHQGYVKRVPLETYRAQRRGGKGVVGATAREEDFVEHVVVTSNHAYLLFFTNRGKVYRLRAFEVPESGRAARGTGLVNVVGMSVNELVTAIIPIRSFEDAGYLFMATRRGTVKRTGLLEFVNARRAGIVALHLQEGDELVGVRLTDGKQEVILATRDGQAIRFRESGVRPTGRAAAGVLGIRLRPGDEVVGLAVASEKPELLTITDLGYGKRTPTSQYRLQARGGYGVRNIRLSSKNGKVVAVRAVAEDDEILLATESGQILRTLVREISTVGRQAQGVRVMRVEPPDRVSAVAVVEAER